MKIKILILIAAVALFSCNSGNEKPNSNNTVNNSGNNIVDNNKDTLTKENPLKLSIKESPNGKYKIGDEVEIKVEATSISPNDTLFIYINSKQVTALIKNNLSYKWNSSEGKLGTNHIEVRYSKENAKYKVSKKIILYSDIKPVQYGYKIKKVYKHDVAAYTQGLFYKNGLLYEATGLKGESTVRQVKFETGEVIKSFAIPTNVFGEGICYHKGKIIQISWEAERGFVYDFNTFNITDEFSYTGQGWGICSDGEKLYMTNGSNEISILDPETFNVVEKHEVYDDKKPIKYLNELEYINGEIYANIYNYEQIVRIDPKTGKVLAVINLKGILPMNDYTPQTDVLNGIAYDSQKKRLFVTGKKWPKLFEIELVKK